RVGKTDRDRLLAALHFPSRASALQSPGLALFHRAPDLGGCFLRIFSCHDYSPSYEKVILAKEDGSTFARRVRSSSPDQRICAHSGGAHSCVPRRMSRTRVAFILRGSPKVARTSNDNGEAVTQG